MDDVKNLIGKQACTLVEDGMVVGLGTGSTAACFIDALAKRFDDEGLNIVTVASSHVSEKHAREKGLPFVSIDAIEKIDITFDGADEITPKKEMIKGAGGALLKEKILASASKELIIMVDETKKQPSLGRTKLPVEVVQFGHKIVQQKLMQFSKSATLRMRSDGMPFITDSGNFIYDLELTELTENAEELDSKISKIVGVVETGLFYGFHGRVVVGYKDGRVMIYE